MTDMMMIRETQIACMCNDQWCTYRARLKCRVRILFTRELCTYCSRSPNHSQEKELMERIIDTTIDYKKNKLNNLQVSFIVVEILIEFDQINSISCRINHCPFHQLRVLTEKTKENSRRKSNLGRIRIINRIDIFEH